MRILTWAVAVVALLWSSYWFLGARFARQSIMAAIMHAQNNGAKISYSDLSLTGYPNRFDLSITKPIVANANNKFNYSSNFIQFLSLSYSPWHIIAAFDNAQEITLFGQAFRLESTDAKASLVLSPTQKLALDRLIFVARDLTLKQGGKNLAKMAVLDLGLRARESLLSTPLEHRHQFGLRASDILMPLSKIPAGLAMSLTLTLDRALDQQMTSELANLRGLELETLSLNWNGAVLSAAGRILPDALGRTQGKINIKLQNWRVFYEMALEQNLIAPKARPNIEGLLNALSKGTNLLELPLLVQDDWVSLGPLPLGRLPDIFAR